MATAYLGLGTNLGDRRANLHAAADAVVATPGVRGAELSPIYETAPVGGPAGQGDYLNAAMRIDTDLPPRDLLDTLLRIEQSLGRERRERWGPRVIDLDLLLYDDLSIDEPGLTLPHPRMHERAFVLRPLADLAPDLVHPVLGQTTVELLSKTRP